MQLSLDLGQGRHYFKAGCATDPKSLDLACYDDPKPDQFKHRQDCALQQ